MSLQCAGCKAAIDADSFYCDQCGLQLMKCGMCGYTGKGKVCPNDRTPLLPAKALAATAGSTSSVAAPAAAPVVVPSPNPTEAAAAPAPSAASPAQGVLCLRSVAHGVQLRPASGDILGRRFGPHAAVLAQFSQISSNHLELQRDPSGRWFAKDMNSFNHSFYNGRRLMPGQAQLLEPGAALALGDIAFAVSFE